MTGPPDPQPLPSPPRAVRNSPTLVTLKRRAEFLRLRGGRRWSCPAFAIEMKPRLAVAGTPPRFGFTVTKALGNAVARNFIRRRLKAAVTAWGVSAGHPDHDYVLIARADAATLEFTALCAHVTTAMARLHGPHSGSVERTQSRRK